MDERITIEIRESDLEIALLCVYYIATVVAQLPDADQAMGAFNRLFFAATRATGRNLMTKAGEWPQARED